VSSGLAPGHVHAEIVVEPQAVVIAELHHRDGGDRLRDRADPVAVIRGDGLAPFGAREPDRVRPGERAVAHHGGDHSRDAVCLRRPEHALERADGAVSHRGR
jgi:hypothetical protein